jgi:Holliday junction DNA helicase RuvA
MIAALFGKVFAKACDRAIVDVHGVGYEVFLTTDVIARMPDTGENVALYIHTQVREDAITLFGFLEEEEKELFLILKSVSGIGPKLALGMLSGMKVDAISKAIIRGDVKVLTALPGVGKRIAERLCVELKEKVGHLGAASGGPLPEPMVAGGSTMTGIIGDAISALMNLGYPESVARSALGRVKRQLGEDGFGNLAVEELIRLALRALV